MCNAVPITDIEDFEIERITSGIESLDEFLGGGFVPGQTCIFAGSPGMGKSTFLNQISFNFAVDDKKVLYVSAEESSGQAKIRATRLGTLHKNIYITETTTVENIIEEIDEINPDLIVIDSLQKMRVEGSNKFGTTNVMKESIDKLQAKNKKDGSVMIFVGHATKDKSIAGVLTLQHDVDANFFLTTDGTQTGRVLKSLKNRFGGEGFEWFGKMTSHGIIGIDEEESQMNILNNFMEINNVETRSHIIDQAQIDYLTSGGFVARGVRSSLDWLVENSLSAEAVKDVIGYELVVRLKK